MRKNKESNFVGDQGRNKDNFFIPEDGIEQVLKDPAASTWLKNALRSAVSRDPVDAANDAEVLYRLLDQRCQSLFRRLT